MANGDCESFERGRSSASAPRWVLCAPKPRRAAAKRNAPRGASLRAPQLRTAPSITVIGVPATRASANRGEGRSSARQQRGEADASGAARRREGAPRAPGARSSRAHWHIGRPSAVPGARAATHRSRTCAGVSPLLDSDCPLPLPAAFLRFLSRDWSRERPRAMASGCRVKRGGGRRRARRGAGGARCESKLAAKTHCHKNFGELWCSKNSLRAKRGQRSPPGKRLGLGAWAQFRARERSASRRASRLCATLGCEALW